MRYAIIIFFGSIYFLSLNSDWQDRLDEKRSIISEPTSKLLTTQLQLFISGQAPAIADERIKQIPIKENGESIVDITILNHPRISVMTKEDCLLAHEFPSDIDPRSDSHSKVRAGVFQALIEMLDNLDKLAPAFGYKAGMLEIKLFEGLRDLGTQKELFEAKMKEICLANPTMTKEEAYAQTSKWVSPYIDNVPVHSTGAAVDIHIFDRESNSFCDMGRFNTSGTLAPTFSTDNRLTSQQKNHRLLMLIAANSSGLINYLNEFWHFSLGDRYAAYFQENNSELRCACYGSIN
ncbi:MAG: hypothetical protein NTU89_03420 [Candidatus Dependentiae bacterium]|nr:hypothetical protein [Candidatus Dependentiae bacterium]